MAKQQPERNAALVSRRESGAAFKVLAYEFNISMDRARKLYQLYGNNKQVYLGEVRPRLAPKTPEAKAIVAEILSEFDITLHTLRRPLPSHGFHIERAARRKAAYVLYHAGMTMSGIADLLRCSTASISKLRDRYEP